jgi:hypothetical protein
MTSDLVKLIGERFPSFNLSEWELTEKEKLVIALVKFLGGEFCQFCNDFKIMREEMRVLFVPEDIEEYFNFEVTRELERILDVKIKFVSEMIE